MSDRSDYQALMRLSNSVDYKVLESKWLYVLSKIEESRDRAATRGQESAWRYYAGQEKGCKLIMLSLAMAIKDLEEKDKDMALENNYDDLLHEIRGEKK